MVFGKLLLTVTDKGKDLKQNIFYPRPLNMQENKLILVQYQQNKTT